MLKNIYFKATLLSIVLLLISCDKDDTPEAENEMEVFTKAVIVVTNLSDDTSKPTILKLKNMIMVTIIAFYLKLKMMMIMVIIL